MEHQVALTFIDGRTLFITAHPNELLMDAAMRGGVTLPVDCREGVCATCRGRCDSGRYSLDYVDEEALTEEEVADRHILACQTRVESDATFSFNFDSEVANCLPATTVTTLVKAVDLLSESIAVLTLEAAPGSDNLTFLPGQYARLQVPHSEEWRAYSFACSPVNQKTWRFIIRLLPDGVMSDYLRSTCQVGDIIPLQGPLGGFYLRETERDKVFIAGGSGVASFISMLENMEGNALHQNKTLLLYGVNHPQDIYGESYLSELKYEYPKFDYKIIVSQAHQEWSGLTGYIPEHLGVNLQGEAKDIYMCGPPPMIDAVNIWLKEQRIEQDGIYFEKFIKSSK